MAFEYEVKVPIVGFAIVEFSSETKLSEEEAIDQALENVVLKDVEEWEGLRHIVRGNVFYGSCNDAEVLSEHEED